MYRGLTILVTLAVAASACAGAGGGADREAAGRPVGLGQATASPREKVPSALDDPRAPGLPRPLVNVDRLISGGPPPDGIPAIDRPRFVRAGQAGWLADREPVLAFNLGSERRAYPVQILVWHEVVNDTVGGVPVAVTYCPLCNSALAFDRRAAGRVLDFGVSGLLYNSDLVMFDRQTQSLWPQIEGRAVAGTLTGTRLRGYPVAMVPWKEWRAANPNGWVLSRDTGHEREYGSNPYVSYDEPTEAPFLFDGEPDRRLPPKTHVVGLRSGDEATAITLDRLVDARVLEIELAGRPVVVFARPGLASALDAWEVADGRELGATGAFDPSVNGRRLHFRADGQHVTDRETGSRWNLFGEAVSGPMKGARLTRSPTWTRSGSPGWRSPPTRRS
ncbi:MAG: DUF3179 domain-containing protein [Streptosporangiales bacterium]|nr:DUF3179 domain-containing protein [Streptosporangiales bacterium]